MRGKRRHRSTRRPERSEGPTRARTTDACRSGQQFRLRWSFAARTTRSRVQRTTDRNGMYLTAVRRAFDIGEADSAQLVKSYGQGPEQGPSRRYGPTICTGASKVRMIGRPNMEKISMSFVERADRSMRIGMRRFARLTDGFSKKAENHAHSASRYFIHYIHYNFCRPHMTLTKAARGIHTTRLWPRAQPIIFGPRKRFSA